MKDEIEQIEQMIQETYVPFEETDFIDDFYSC